MLGLLDIAISLMLCSNLALVSVSKAVVLTWGKRTVQPPLEVVLEELLLRGGGFAAVSLGDGDGAVQPFCGLC